MISTKISINIGTQDMQTVTDCLGLALQWNSKKLIEKNMIFFYFSLLQ